MDKVSESSALLQRRDDHAVVSLSIQGDEQTASQEVVKAPPTKLKPFQPQKHKKKEKQEKKRNTDDHEHAASHEEEGEERQITRLEMWIDALASIVVTLSVLPMMELLNEPKEERELGIPFLVFTTAVGFAMMSYLMINTYVIFNWFDHRHVNDPILLGLGLFFLACLSLFAFGVQSLMQLYRDTTAVFFFGIPFIGIYFSCLLLFVYSLYTTDVRKKIPQSMVSLEVLYYVLVIAVFGGMMLASSLISEDYQNYVIYVVTALLMTLHYTTRREAHLKKLLPGGYPQERIDVFTDGVYAVAVTLFLIEIRYPSHPDENRSLAISFLHHEWRAVAGHFISFGLLGVHWSLHNFISAMTKIQTRATYAISIGHCMAAALFPFTIKLSLLNEYAGWEIAAPMLCWAELALTQLLLWLRARGTINDKWTDRLSIVSVVIAMAAYLGYELDVLLSA